MFYSHESGVKKLPFLKMQGALKLSFLQYLPLERVAWPLFGEMFRH